MMTIFLLVACAGVVSAEQPIVEQRYRGEVARGEPGVVDVVHERHVLQVFVGGAIHFHQIMVVQVDLRKCDPCDDNGRDVERTHDCRQCSNGTGVQGKPHDGFQRVKITGIHPAGISLLMVYSVDPDQRAAQRAIVKQEAMRQIVEKVVDHQDHEDIQQKLPPGLSFERKTKGQYQGKDHHVSQQAPDTDSLLNRRVETARDSFFGSLLVERLGLPDRRDQQQHTFANDGNSHDPDGRIEGQQPLIVFQDRRKQRRVHYCLPCVMALDRGARPRSLLLYRVLNVGQKPLSVCLSPVRCRRERCSRVFNSLPVRMSRESMAPANQER